MRKIRKDEIKKVAQIMASSFVDYPLYNVFFPDDEKKEKRIFYFFWYRIYTRRDFTFLSDDEALAISVQHPYDRLRSSFPLWLHPAFFFGFLFHIPLKAIRLVKEFGRMEEKYWKQYYHPKKDAYVQAICVLKQQQGSGDFFRAVKQLDHGEAIYCETHTERNVKLYHLLLGLSVVAQVPWHGVTHYVMRREAHE